ncbi:trigger factor [bacterium]|nr:trigger factor [bacterium]
MSTPFQITVESPEPCQRVIKVQVPREEFDQQYQKRLTAAVREHQRPGFRKGKTPRGIVENEVGSRLRVETVEALVPQAFRAAIVENELYPIGEPQVENLQFEEGEDLGFDLKIEVRPEVEARDYEGLPLVERQVEVTDAEVDEVVERMRESKAVHDEVDRPSQASDQVVLDLVPLGEDGEPQEERRMSSQPLEVGAENNLPEFNEALAGVTAGQDLDIRVDYPDDFPNEALRGQAMTFRCHVDEVREKRLPEVDDAFASQLEEGQTLLELRGKIRQSLTDDAQKRSRQDLDGQVLDRLIERNEVAVPPSMVEAWLESGVEDMRRRQAQMGRELTVAELTEYREAARPVAERQIKGMFLFEAVRAQEGIEVTDEDVEERVEEIAAENGFDLAKYREYVAQGEEKDRIRHELLDRRTYDFLLSRANVEPAAAEEEG